MMQRSTAVFAALLAAALGAQTDAQAQDIRSMAMINLPCAVLVHGTEFPRSYTVTNTAGATIPAKSMLRFRSSDGDSGTISLSADLPPNGTASGQGTKYGGGGPLTCAGTYAPGLPDLIVKGYTWNPTTKQVAVQVQNANNFVAAGASVTRVELQNCNGGALSTADSPATAIGKGETKTLSFTMKDSKQPYNTYFLIRADATNVVPEKNENNNVSSSQYGCIN